MLRDKGIQILGTKYETREDPAWQPLVRVDRNQVLPWRAQVLTELSHMKSQHYFRAAHPEWTIDDYYDSAELCVALLNAAIEDLDHGFTFEIRELMRSEVETGLLEQAAELLDKNYHRAAATLAGIVIEQHMRALAKMQNVGLVIGKKSLTMGALNDALAKASAYDSNMHRRISLCVPIRNHAAHGEHLPENDAEYIVGEAPKICADLSSGS